jgi:hypothetical protein
MRDREIENAAALAFIVICLGGAAIFACDFLEAVW